MRTIKTVKYKLPAFWASALINADRTGLSDNDERELDLVMDSLGQGRLFGNALDCTEYAEFSNWHDAPGVLPCDCLTFTFPKL